MTVDFSFDSDGCLEIDDYDVYISLDKRNTRRLYKKLRKHYGDAD